MKPQDTVDAGMMLCSEAEMQRYLRAKAAEEMYEALTALLTLVESNAPDGYYTEHPAITAAGAALAKADGKS